MIFTHEQHHGRLVGPRRRPHLAWSGDEDEPSDSVGVIRYLIGQSLQAKLLTGDLGTDRGVEAGVRVGDLLRCTRGRSRLRYQRLGEVDGEPVSALRGGVRMGQHVAYLIKTSAGSPEKRELYGKQHLANDHQPVAVGQVV